MKQCELPPQLSVRVLLCELVELSAQLAALTP